MAHDRYKKITSSSIASIFGCNPYQTALEAQIKMLRTDEAPIESSAIERGNILEDPTAKWCGDQLGVQWIKAPRIDHPKYPDKFSDAVDYFHVRDDGEIILCEAKTASGRVAHEWGEEGTDEIPKHYLLQCYWHLIHWPMAKRCYVPVLIGGFEFEFRLYVVERDEELQRQMVQVALRWHQKHIVEEVPCIASAGDTDAIKHMFKTHTSDTVATDDPLLVSLARQYKKLDAEIKGLEDEKEGIKNRLCQAIGHGSGLVGDWGKAMWSTRKGGISWKKLVEDNFTVADEMKEKYQTEFRVFTVTLKKEG